jgi:hypothetical protein
MAAPVIEQVVAALVARLEAVVPSLQPRARFKRSDETLTSTEAPARGSMRRFNVDAVSGQDDSQEGNGVQNPGVADRRARFTIRVSYPLAQQEQGLELVLPSDGEWAMRALARSANWAGTPVQRTTCRWSVDRGNPEKLFLVLALEVQYRDQE